MWYKIFHFIYLSIIINHIVRYLSYSWYIVRGLRLTSPVVQFVVHVLVDGPLYLRISRCSFMLFFLDFFLIYLSCILLNFV